MQKLLGLGFTFSLLTACATDAQVSSDPIDQEIERLTGELADLPGEVVVTRASQLPFAPDLEARVATADKVIHVFGDGHVAAFLGTAQQDLPTGVTPHRTFTLHGGDTVIATQDLLSTYLAQQETSAVANASGLVVGDGKQWPESTVAFTINSNIQGAERTAVLSAIDSWNFAIDGGANQMKVRFVPRYAGDGRPYVDFTKGGLPASACGQSQVGRHDNIFTNWFSHSININTGCFTERTLHHEMGHTAGLNHEQQRCDRDNFVNVPVGGIDCERRCGGDSSDFGPYNYLSVMHYQYGFCSMSQRTPSGAFRGSPSQGGSASRLDINDVQGLNQSYVARPALPPIGPGRFFTLNPVHAPTKVVQLPIGAGWGTQVILADRVGSTREQFFFTQEPGGFVRIRSRFGTNLCLDDSAQRTTNGAPVGIWDCVDTDSERWIVAPNAANPSTFDLINKVSGKSLDIAGWGTANGTLVQQWDHTGGTNQRFTLTPVF